MDLKIYNNIPPSVLEDEYIILQDIYLKGDDVQKLSVIQALPQLLLYDANATLTRIVPKIQQELPKSSCEFHIATSKIFKLLIEKQLPLNLISAVLQGIESKDPDVSNAWTDTIIAVIPILPLDQIKTSVIPTALARSQMSTPVYMRVNTSRVLGKCAAHPKLGNIDVKTIILPAVQSLCQDSSPDVRATMCAQLHLVAQGLGPNLVQSGLLPNLVELAADDSGMVRSAATAAAVQMIPFLNKETRSDTIVPLIKQLCQKTKDIGDTTYPMIARQFGVLVDALQDDLTAADCIWFLQFFKTLACKGAHLPPTKENADTAQAVVCREQCAYNLPAVTQFTVKKVANQLELWHDIFGKLANDPCYLVRKTTAASVHQVARILGTQCKLIKDDLIKLLRDDSEDILMMLVPNVGSTLELFTLNGVLSREQTNQSTLEIARAILKCHVELAKGHNWRIKTDLLVQLERLPYCVPSDFIHQHFSPVLLNCLLQARPKPLRSQAGRTLLIFLRYNLKEMQRKWIRDNIIQNLCYAKSSYTRQIYINVCSHAIKLFSGNYFKKNFFDSLILLADDPVPNVRWSLIGCLPDISRMLVMPEDKKLQVSIDNIIMKMEMEEKDRDVKSYFREKLKQIRAPFENKQTHQMEDKKKQDEETLIAQGRAPTMSQNRAQISSSSMGAPPPSEPSREPVNRSASQRSSTVSARAKAAGAAPVPSDMRFLEQHFYIDAGVNLPPDNLAVDIGATNVEMYTLEEEMEEKLDKSSIENELEAFSLDNLSTANITDDVKVNLRRRSNQQPKECNTNALFKPKRHSSVMPLSSQNCKQSLNRRSLNIGGGGGDCSKIPVCLKKSKSIADVKKENDCLMNANQKIVVNESKLKKPRPKSEVLTNNSNSAQFLSNKSIKNVPIIDKNKLVTKASGLPVFKRSQSETRKA